MRINILYTNEIKKYLLNIARIAISERYNIDTIKIDIDEEDKALLQKHSGVFVTLEKNGALRGCIGYVEPIMSLLEAVVSMAHASAFSDNRFNIVSKDELPHINISITILTPIESIETIEEFILYKHGLVIRKGSHRGLLLPQVAKEHNMNRDDFISNTCLKAGLDKDIWKNTNDIEYYVFEGIIFSEKDFST